MVSVEHPEYDATSAKWERCRDAVEGEDAVKGKGIMYLPKPHGAEADEYSAYVARATFFGAAERTVKGLAGAVMRKPIEVSLPEGKEDPLDSIGLNGESLQEIARQIIEEQLICGRVGIFVDAGSGRNAEPYITTYVAENIVNWKTEVIDGRSVLVLIVLKETYYNDSADNIFEQEVETQYRVLRLEELDSGKNIYSVTVWRKKKGPPDITGGLGAQEEYAPGDTVYPALAGGKSMDFIPFVFVNVSSTDAGVQKPPLLDLVNTNLKHYVNSADHEHGLHFTALPTAWVAGFDKDSTKLYIGSTRAWVSSDPTARAGFLEFTGQGLSAILKAMEDKVKLMAVLGSRLLEETKKVGETATAVRLRTAGEKSVLASISHTASEGLTNALRWVWAWKTGKISDEVKVLLNADFDVSRIGPEELEKLLQAVQAKAISFDTWFFNLQRGEVLPDTRTKEEELQLIKDGPDLSPPTPVAPTPVDKKEGSPRDTPDTDLPPTEDD